MSAPRGQNQNHDSIIVFLPQYVTKWNKHNPSKRHTKTITNRAIQNRSRPGCLLQSPVFTDEKRKTIKHWELEKKNNPAWITREERSGFGSCQREIDFFYFFYFVVLFPFPRPQTNLAFDKAMKSSAVLYLVVLSRCPESFSEFPKAQANRVFDNAKQSSAVIWIPQESTASSWVDSKVSNALVLAAEWCSGELVNVILPVWGWVIIHGRLS